MITIICNHDFQVGTRRFAAGSSYVLEDADFRVVLRKFPDWITVRKDSVPRRDKMLHACREK